MFVGIGVGIGRQRFGGGIFSEYASRVVADGGVTEAGSCVDAVSTLLKTASLLLVPSGYKSTKVYSQIPTNGNGDLTWTRASTANRTNSTGLLESMATGVPRLSYMYGSCPALLLEPQRTNLALNSGDFQNASWGKANLTFNSTETAPDGTSSARNYSTTGAYAYALQTNTITSGSVYTSSVFLKYTSGVGSLAVRFTDSVSVNFISVTANLINGTIGSVSYGGNGANGSATITALTNGWYRVTVSGSIVGTNAGFIVSNLVLGATTFSVWGAQLELGAYVTTYIPTTTATVTRIADSFTRNNIYTNNLISASGGTWFVQLLNNISLTRDTFADGLILKDNTGQNGFVFTFGSSSPSAAFCSIRKIVGGVLTSLYTTTTTTVKIAIKWNGTTADIFANGTKVISATSFTPTQLENLTGSGADTPKFIQQMALYPSALSDTDCTTLTTL